MVASDASDALIEASRDEDVEQSAMFWPIDRKRTSRVSCVRPRWDREPRIVCDCTWFG